MPKKRPAFWVSRDEGDGYENTVDLWIKEPVISTGLWYFTTNNNRLATICYKYFQQATGISIKPGECVRVRFSAEIVEEK
jgi:hypothetical protein